jgi:hypothetical protein
MFAIIKIVYMAAFIVKKKSLGVFAKKKSFYIMYESYKVSF